MRPVSSTNNNISPSCIGIDDGPFLPHRQPKTSFAPLIAVCLKGPRLHHVEAGWITVDGLDATAEAKTLLQKLPSAPVLLSGVTFAGFNLIDPHVIQRHFKTPTIVVVRSRPDNKSVKNALVKHFEDWRRRWDIIGSLGPLREVRTVKDEPPIYFESFGCTVNEARRILTRNVWVARVPEPIRVAGLIARGLFQNEVQVGRINQ